MLDVFIADHETGAFVVAHHVVLGSDVAAAIDPDASISPCERLEIVVLYDIVLYGYVGAVFHQDAPTDVVMSMVVADH